MSESRARHLVTRREFLTKATLAATLLSVAPILSACGQQASPAATQAPAKAAEPTKAQAAAEPTRAPEPTKATSSTASLKGQKIAAIFPSGGATTDQFYADEAKAVQDAVGVTVEVSTLPFEKLMDKEFALVAASSGDIDVFGTHYAQIGRFYDALTPLSDMAAKDGFLAKDYANGTFDAFTNNKGQLISIPYNADQRALFHRVDIFEKAGIKEPPKTWDELVAVAKQVQTPPEMYGYIIVGKGDPALREFSDLLWENGTDFLEGGLKPSKPSWNSPEGVEALQWWYDLIYTNKVVPPGVPSYGWEELSQLFAAGQSVMDKWWNFALFDDPAQSKIVGKYSVSKLLKKKDKVRTTLVAHGRGVNKFSKYPDASWEFIKIMCSKPNQLKAVKGGVMNPALLSALGEYAAEATGVRKQYFDIVNQQSPYGYTWPLFPEFSQIQPILWGEIEKVLTQQKKPKEALDFAADEATKIMRDAKLI